ncbi:hypothetical protein LY13_001282 [Prauserella aidingensis]|uniref:hypothetical protein n=1 Tax=Prauserella aidingensis TaxID=387890 RepID=UPI0020A381FA|nr:hypothetical protein [Prauserella aidingensis]MCP2252539.1 hypothetical protein [Prauserella aidingensis]
MPASRSRLRRIRTPAVLTVVAVLVAAAIVTWARVPRDDLEVLDPGGLRVAPGTPVTPPRAA